MATNSRSWRIWVLLAVAGVAAWQVARLFTPRRSTTEKLINQLWVERMPTHARDMVRHFVAIDQDGQHLGAVGRASRWRVYTDGFVWRQRGNELSYVTPQNRCRTTLTARTWKCAGQAPAPFDICLELVGKDQRLRYYSRIDWAIGPRGRLEGDDQPAFGQTAVGTALAVESDGRVEDADAECPSGPE